MSNTLRVSPPEKRRFNSDPTASACLCPMAAELSPPSSALSPALTGTGRAALRPDNCAQTGLLLVNFQWGKLRRARWQTKFWNFQKSTGLLESSNCCYL